MIVFSVFRVHCCHQYKQHTGTVLTCVVFVTSMHLYVASVCVSCIILLSFLSVCYVQCHLNAQHVGKVLSCVVFLIKTQYRDQTWFFMH